MHAYFDENPPMPLRKDVRCCKSSCVTHQHNITAKDLATKITFALDWGITLAKTSGCNKAPGPLPTQKGPQGRGQGATHFLIVDP